MNETTSRQTEMYQLHPIGHVQHSPEGSQLVVYEAFRAGLKQLNQFSHVIVFWWADKHDNPPDRARVDTDLPYAPGVIAGVFACRSPYRPNPIGMTISPIFGVDEQNGIISLAWIDALEGTPILDLKPYVPITERVRDVQVAKWFEVLPQWMEDAATFDFVAAGFAE